MRYLIVALFLLYGCGATTTHVVFTANDLPGPVESLVCDIESFHENAKITEYECIVSGYIHLK